MNDREVRAQLDRILASATFAEAERARKFLRFVVENALAGRAEEIKESVIGVEALGRPASFDPRTDPIVRVEAGRLRTRLLTYYQSEGLHDTVVIELPRGGYVPQFVERKSPSAPAGAPVRKTHRPLLLASVLILALAFGWAWFRGRAPMRREGVSLSILPPEGSDILDSAVSPDGRNMAFTAAASGNIRRLWIRPLDSLQPRLLPGTDGAARPFWSPDSRSVGFFSAERLQIIPISGGPARTLCPVQAAFGGSWGTRGTILFGQRPDGVVLAVPAEGGTPKPVTTLDRAHGEIAHEFPEFLPDGRHFLYSVIHRAPDESSLRAGSLDSGASTPLLNADPGVAYAPSWAGGSGALLFGYRGALMAQPFDAGRLALTGAAVQIAPEVRHVEARADFSVSSGGILAYQGRSDRNRQLTWFDRVGKELGTAGSPNNYQSIELSPDEKRVAIQAFDPSSGRSEIWILDLDRGLLSRLGGGGAEEGFAPTWSPDGSELIFSAESGSVMNLMRQRVDQVKAGVFLDAPGVAVATDWSGDGKLVTYTRFQTDAGIWVKPAAGDAHEKGRLFPPAGVECCAVFSPTLFGEGPRWLAYTSDETGEDEVYVRALPAGDSKWQVSNSGGWLPHWRPDGRELFYIALDGTLMAVDTAVTRSSGFTAGAPKPLFATTIQPFSYPTLPGNSYAVTRDGRFLVNRLLNAASPQSITVVLPSR